MKLRIVKDPEPATNQGSSLRKPKTRVLLVDDHPILRRGLAQLINLEADMMVCGEAEDAAKAFDAAGTLKPDVAVIDISLKGGNPPGEPKPIAWKDSAPDIEADEALRKLAGVATRFADETTPYRSRERPMWARRAYGDYDHLARVREWSLSGGAGDDAGGGG